MIIRSFANKNREAFNREELPPKISTSAGEKIIATFEKKDGED